MNTMKRILCLSLLLLLATVGPSLAVWEQLGVGVRPRVRRAIEELRDVGNIVNPAHAFYVDKNVTASGDGDQWSTAFKTIAEGITAANADTTGGVVPGSHIFINPGVYAENLTTMPYSCTLIGLGKRGVSGAGVEIHPVSGSALVHTADSGNAAADVITFGTQFINISFCTDTAHPQVSFDYAQEVLFDHCTFEQGTPGLATYGIYVKDAVGLDVIDCDVIISSSTDGFDNFLLVDDGTNSYFKSCTLVGNIIRESGTAISITTGYDATGSIIINNFIEAEASATGVLEAAGETHVINNIIVTGSGGDAISHTGGAIYTTGNVTNINGTSVWEVTGP